LLNVDDSAVDWFVEHGYSESMGARPMARLIQEKLKKELAEDILFGKLSANGGEVQVSCKNDELVLTISERKPQEKKELTPAKN